MREFNWDICTTKPSKFLQTFIFNNQCSIGDGSLWGLVRVCVRNLGVCAYLSQSFGITDMRVGRWQNSDREIDVELITFHHPVLRMGLCLLEISLECRNEVKRQKVRVNAGDGSAGKLAILDEVITMSHLNPRWNEHLLKSLDTRLVVDVL